jgi:hypothetical protein
MAPNLYALIKQTLTDLYEVLNSEAGLGVVGVLL